MQQIRTMSNQMYPIDPDFTFISCLHERRMISTAYQVVSNLEKWDYLRTFDPGCTGFMLTKDLVAVNIMDEIERSYQGHSGCSMGCTMRVIQMIAEQGYRRYRKKYMNKPDDEPDIQPTVVESDFPETNDESENNPAENVDEVAYEYLALEQIYKIDNNTEKNYKNFEKKISISCKAPGSKSNTPLQS